MKIHEDRENKPFFVISDLHLYHGNIIKYCDRPFLDKKGEPDVNKMNMTIYQNWVKTIKDNDDVYFLGDLTMGFSKKETAKILSENLTGNIKYFQGNHDKLHLIDDTKKIREKVYNVKYKDLVISLSHYPPAGECGIKFEGDMLIFGHVHNSTKFDRYNTFNCCVERINYTPIHIDEVLKILLKRNIDNLNQK